MLMGYLCDVIIMIVGPVGWLAYILFLKAFHHFSRFTSRLAGYR